MINGKTVGMIAACDVTGLIGYDNAIPWKNSVDMKRFRKLTIGTTLVMGRKTFESLPPKGLPERTIHILHRSEANIIRDDKLRFTDIVKAIEQAPTEMVWVAGGAQIYELALQFNIPDFIDLSIINGISLGPIKDRLDVSSKKRVNLSPIPYTYRVVSEEVNPDDSNLWHRRYEVRPEWAWKEDTSCGYIKKHEEKTETIS